jgi:hypothetical protein
MRVWALNDYELPGSHARSLNLQRQPKAREPASDGQPENLKTLWEGSGYLKRF